MRYSLLKNCSGLRKLLGIFIALVACGYLSAQQVSGVVTDANDGFGLPGVSVLVPGTTNGTITDVDGNYTLDVDGGKDLQFSYIGYATITVAINGKTKIDVELSEDTQKIDEVVVTALGIKREKKALGYSMQELKGESLTQTRDANVANALAGKVAGLQIKQNGTGVGGSTRIVIRGNNSIAGNNQPLVVVDGVPIDNFSGGTDDFYGNGNVDKGSGMSDISPDDIESMSVLKGPAAAALYGSRAGNGVVMITTKKGSQSKGVGVNYNLNFTAENPMQTPTFQNVYGQGAAGAFDNNVYGSWGPKMDGSTKDMALGSFGYAARNNNLYKDFLRTGTSWTNSVDISKSSEDITFRAGVTRLDNKGVVPNSGLDRTSINLRSTAKLAKWLSADVKVNYINQHTNNRIKLATDPDNIFLNYLSMPRSVGFSDYSGYESNNWKRADGSAAGFVVDHKTNAESPFWSAYRMTNNDKKDRLIGFAALDFTFTDWLSLKLRSGMDNYTVQYEWVRGTGTPYWETNGSMQAKSEKFNEINSDFLLTAKGNWDRFGIVGTVGGNIMYRSTALYTENSGEFIIPDFHAIANGKTHGGEYEKTRKQINSVYATASMSWDDYLYLDLTARNDWSSTLPKDNASYFYPSVGASWIFTQMINKMGGSTGFLTFGKLRASWAQVGNDTDAYMLRDYYKIGYDIKGGIFSANNEDWMANPNLKNETINSWELGLELKGFNNRVGVDLAYYKKNSKDQILKIDVPSATGFKKKMINAGNIENSGVEIALNATPVITETGFTWDTQLNWSKNKNKVVSLTSDTKEQILSDPSVTFLKIVAHEGGAFGDIYGYAYERDDNGNIMVGADGVPLRSEDMVKLGNNQPDWMLGWNNSFSYKNFSLNFLIDMRKGGDVYMGSIRQGSTNGSLEMTLDGREDGIVVPGVLADGSKNTQNVSAEKYWNGISGITEAWMYDATNIRLRELSLGYSVPKSMLSKTPFTALKLSFVARNLFMIYSKTKGFDPEAAYTSGNAQGIEYGSMPTMRSLGFNLNVAF
ncbi:SusC/RagA family TonB-linked outer membrane protein [Parabacteroides gordonii]|jgi:TonB-linked SusC/RagA family outer membrane protein|uniref:SusC/RagA family TonB-linked outer membrane protein n=1 Tax=Parabacteroides gordonii TaxID=574930 RepID=UPI00241EBA9F|nr:SusC/RagA family TonB-linked outer membrane protein [Parabacteroides gordonii]